LKRWLERAATLAVAAFVAATLAPFGARSWWVLDLFTHFRLQYVVFGALLLVLAAALRMWRTAAVIASGIALGALPLAHYVPALQGSAAPPPANSDLRVLTANLSRRDYSSAELLAIVGDAAPAVVLLVEFTSVTDERFRALDESYPYHIKVPRRDAFGLALFSRYPLDAQEIDLTGAAAIRARVAAPDGEVTVFGVHLRSPTSAGRALDRNRQLEALVQLTSAVAGPVIVMGDLNITPLSPFFSDWLERSGLHDAGAGRGPWFSWPTFLPIAGIPIDHCVVSADFEVVSHRRLPAFGSDHYPVLAQLRLR
jgi:endonuclease/exonuclease/phosphatase (EEP) superfamily protein YafD